MRQITLMRHGQPQLPASAWIAPAAMGHWIAAYNRAEVAANSAPAASVRHADAAATIVASDACRAISSVRALGHHAVLVDALFREAPLPFAPWRFPRLPAQLWAACFRLCWLCGYARDAESLTTTRQRAKAAAEKLLELAAQGPVLLVAHGIINRLIAKELQALGCAGPRRQPSSYWSVSVFLRS